MRNILMVTVSLCLFSCGKEEAENPCTCDLEGHYVSFSYDAGTGEMNLTRNGVGSYSLLNTAEIFDVDSDGEPFVSYAWDNEIIGSTELIGCDSIRLTLDWRREYYSASIDSTEIDEGSNIADLVFLPCFNVSGPAADKGCDTLCMYMPEAQNVNGLIDDLGFYWIRQ
jgi:hypothetical protein